MYKFAVCHCIFCLQSLYSRVPACQITTYYYVGFAYLMMKRYQVKDFLTIALWLSKKSLTFAPAKCIFRLNFHSCLSWIWNCHDHLSPQFKYLTSHINLHSSPPIEILQSHNVTFSHIAQLVEHCSSICMGCGVEFHSSLWGVGLNSIQAWFLSRLYLPSCLILVVDITLMIIHIFLSSWSIYIIIFYTMNKLFIQLQILLCCTV